MDMNNVRRQVHDPDLGAPPYWRNVEPRGPPSDSIVLARCHDLASTPGSMTRLLGLGS
jgi:hypothetical protein